ncbi:MAG: DUF4964 domain-containing protein, partial [Akkermansiaceae bacterium]|nr:DUF4964 domain-containing protein [Armatimonadota bacterium]
MMFAPRIKRHPPRANHTLQKVTKITLMKRSEFLTLSAAVGAAMLTLSGIFAAPAAAQSMPRPPSVPLITHDPYFSVWSAADTLSGEDTRHWTGTTQPVNSLIHVDGKTYRLMGKGTSTVPALEQTRLEVLPTRTIYTFAGAGV